MTTTTTTTPKIHRVRVLADEGRGDGYETMFIDDTMRTWRDEDDGTTVTARTVFVPSPYGDAFYETPAVDYDALCEMADAFAAREVPPALAPLDEEWPAAAWMERYGTDSYILEPVTLPDGTPLYLVGFASGWTWGSSDDPSATPFDFLRDEVAARLGSWASDYDADAIAHDIVEHGHYAVDDLSFTEFVEFVGYRLRLQVLDAVPSRCASYQIAISELTANGDLVCHPRCMSLREADAYLSKTGLRLVNEVRKGWAHCEAINVQDNGVVSIIVAHK